MRRGRGHAQIWLCLRPHGRRLQVLSGKSANASPYIPFTINCCAPAVQETGSVTARIAVDREWYGPRLLEPQLQPFYSTTPAPDPGALTRMSLLHNVPFQFCMEHPTLWNAITPVQAPAVSSVLAHKRSARLCRNRATSSRFTKYVS